METWRTYTPDGRMLEVEYAAGEWKASCDGTRAVGSSALEAIADAVGTQQASIAPKGGDLEAWIAEHAARLESEAG